MLWFRTGGLGIEHGHTIRAQTLKQSSSGTQTFNTRWSCLVMHHSSFDSSYCLKPFALLAHILLTTCLYSIMTSSISKVEFHQVFMLQGMSLSGTPRDVQVTHHAGRSFVVKLMTLKVKLQIYRNRVSLVHMMGCELLQQLTFANTSLMGCTPASKTVHSSSFIFFIMLTSLSSSSSSPPASPSKPVMTQL